ncbi:LuxR C-terminal-related transcriptional regulator [Streptomyces sp. ID05-26A]|nr:LuxR C-terminal-related transcriptional regulator [Streptomyces sp. ID05-26A]
MDALRRAGDEIARLAGRQLDLVSFWREASGVLSDAVPHFLSPCWYTLDPASLLITSHFQEGLQEFPAEWLTAEYFADDVHKLTDVSRSASGVSTLHEATGGDPSSSSRWRANMEYGADQEMIAALRTRSGEVWGAVGLYREPGRPLFAAAELGFIRSVAPRLAEGARRALLVGEAGDPEGPEAPGLLVLSEDGAVESVTPGTERWLDDLPDGGDGHLASSVLAIAVRALRSGSDAGDSGEVAMSRVLTRSGRWVVLHGASLVGPGSRRVAVIVEPAHPGRISPLLMSAYGLTEREQEVTRLVLQGSSTTEIAAALVVSAHTVQQHLKSVFDKTGVRSRRDLVGKIFFAHYEPRVRDNERRAAAGRPLRGGPFPGSE